MKNTYHFESIPSTSHKIAVTAPSLERAEERAEELHEELTKEIDYGDHRLELVRVETEAVVDFKESNHRLAGAEPARQPEE